MSDKLKNSKSGKKKQRQDVKRKASSYPGDLEKDIRHDSSVNTQQFIQNGSCETQ